MRRATEKQIQEATEADTSPIVSRLRDHPLVDMNGRTKGQSIPFPDRLTVIEKGARIPYPDDVERPKTRGECAGGERPCPFVSCRYNLYLDVNPQSGTVKINFPHLDVDQLEQTCALDVADAGGETLDRTGQLINVTRERTRQIEASGIRKLGQDPVMVAAKRVS